MPFRQAFLGYSNFVDSMHTLSNATLAAQEGSKKKKKKNGLQDQQLCFKGGGDHHKISKSDLKVFCEFMWDKNCCLHECLPGVALGVLRKERKNLSEIGHFEPFWKL